MHLFLLLSCTKPGNESAQSFQRIAAGWFHTCGINKQGKVVCWGSRHAYGGGEEPSGRFGEVSSGSGHSCALDVNGLINCWDTTAFMMDDMENVAFTQIVSGYNNVCGLTVDGDFVCGGTSGNYVATWEGPFERVTSDGWSACALDPQGYVLCSEYGDSYLIDDHRFLQISGRGTLCGITTSQDIYCWGGDGAGSSIPEYIQGPFISLSTSSYFLCGVYDDFSVECWGDNEYGQIDVPSGFVGWNGAY